MTKPNCTPCPVTPRSNTPTTTVAAQIVSPVQRSWSGVRQARPPIQPIASPATKGQCEERAERTLAVARPTDQYEGEDEHDVDDRGEDCEHCG